MDEDLTYVPAQPETSETITLTKAELQAVVEAQVKQFASELLAKPAAATDGSDWMQQLALTMAELTDQGTSRKRVAPEILAQRAKAHVRMVAAITAARERVKSLGLEDNPDEAQARGLVPEYQVRVQIYLDEQLIQPYQVGNDRVARPTEIFWFGIPSDGMIPLNDLAKKIHGEFRASVGDTEAVKGADNRPYWITAKNGLVVKGHGPARQMVGAIESSIPSDLDRSGSNNMLKVRSPINPNAPTVAILGTVAAPARQNTVGTH